MAFTGKNDFQQSEATVISDKVGSNEDLVWLDEDQNMEHFHAVHPSPQQLVGYTDEWWISWFNTDVRSSLSIFERS